MLNRLYVWLAIIATNRKLKKASSRRELLDNEYRRYAMRDANSPQARSSGDQAKIAIKEELGLQNHLHDLKRRQKTT
jgi:hypothetical protein